MADEKRQESLDCSGKTLKEAVRLLDPSKRDLVLEVMLNELPKTKFHKETVSIISDYCDAKIDKKLFGSYLELAGPKYTNLNKPNHFSLVKALYQIVLDDLLARRPPRTAVVIGASETVGDGYYAAFYGFGMFYRHEQFAFWLNQLRALGYKHLPNEVFIGTSAVEETHANH